MCESELNLWVCLLCYFWGQGDKKEARRLEEERHGASTRKKNPTGGSCSVAGASPTSFSQSVTPFPPGLWGCT